MQYHQPKKHLLRGQHAIRGRKRFWMELMGRAYTDSWRENMISSETGKKNFEWERSNLWSWSMNFDSLFLPIVFHTGIKLAPSLHDARTTFRSGMRT